MPEVEPVCDEIRTIQPCAVFAATNDTWAAGLVLFSARPKAK
jgi:hypothetical protein